VAAGLAGAVALAATVGVVRSRRWELRRATAILQEQAERHARAEP
jgi:hypothetical protein